MSEANKAVATEEDLTSYFVVARTGLVNFATSFVSDRERAEDIVAEAYIQVVGMIRKGRGPEPEKLESYVKVCIRNESFRQAKRHSREVPTPFIETLADQMIEAVSNPNSDGTWDEDAASRAFHSLSVRSQSVLRLATIEGRRVTDISKQLGISERAVVSAAFRARESLRTRYLVEVSAASHTCRDTRIEHLASYARDQASSRREMKISAHVQHCSACEQTLQHMRALRLPGLVILGIAVTASETLSTHGGSAQAAELSTKNQALHAVRGGSGAATGKIIGGASIVMLLAASAFLFTVLQPQSPDPSAPKATVAQPNHTSDTDSTDASTGKGAEPAPTPSSGPDASPPPGATDENDDLPDGVRSVEWSEIPDNYAAGQKGARLLLSVGFNQSGDPADYNVIVTLPDGVSMERASAGCTANGSAVRCDPPENLVPTDLFRWQFYVDLDDGFSGGLPTVQLVKSTA